MTETDFADSLNGERCALSARWDAGAAGQRCYENEIIFVALHKLIEKFSAKKTKFFLTYRVWTAILTERVCESTGVLCEEAGDCSRLRGNFRGVCPVSKEYSARNRAAET